MNGIHKIKVLSSCTVVQFSNGVELCSHTPTKHDLAETPNLRKLDANSEEEWFASFGVDTSHSDINIDDCLVAYYDKDAGHYYFTTYTEEEIQAYFGEPTSANRIYFILIPADI